MKQIFLFLIVSTLLLSCKKDEKHYGSKKEYEYFAFGTAYGECGGNCANFFKISNRKIYPDSMLYYTGVLEFQSSPLANDKYLLAKQLMDNFPVYLSNSPGKTFGCPDCHDQGGIHIETKMNGVVKTWHIDTDPDKQPVQIRSYIEQLYNILGQL